MHSNLFSFPERKGAFSFSYPDCFVDASGDSIPINSDEIETFSEAIRQRRIAHTLTTEDLVDLRDLIVMISSGSYSIVDLDLTKLMELLDTLIKSVVPNSRHAKKVLTQMDMLVRANTSPSTKSIIPSSLVQQVLQRQEHRKFDFAHELGTEESERSISGYSLHYAPIPPYRQQQTYTPEGGRPKKLLGAKYGKLYVYTRPSIDGLVDYLVEFTGILVDPYTRANGVVVPKLTILTKPMDHLPIQKPFYILRDQPKEGIETSAITISYHDSNGELQGEKKFALIPRSPIDRLFRDTYGATFVV